MHTAHSRPLNKRIKDVNRCEQVQLSYRCEKALRRLGFAMVVQGQQIGFITKSSLIPKLNAKYTRRTHALNAFYPGSCINHPWMRV